MYDIYRWHILRIQNTQLNFFFNLTESELLSGPPTLSAVFENSPFISLSLRISFLTHFPFGDFLSISKPAQVFLSLKKKKIQPPSVLYSPLTCCYFLFLSYINFSKVEYICCLFSSPLLLNYRQYRSHPNHCTEIVLSRVTQWILTAKSNVHFQIYLSRPHFCM